MVELSEELRDSIHNEDLTEFGEILHKNWELKQKLSSKISNSSIDTFYNKARKAGAIGGKILGSGGGGFLLLYCEDDHKNTVRKVLSNLKETPFCFEPA